MKRNHTPFASRLSSNYTFPSNPETSSVNSSRFVMFLGCFLRSSASQKLSISAAQHLCPYVVKFNYYLILLSSKLERCVMFFKPHSNIVRIAVAWYLMLETRGDLSLTIAQELSSSGAQKLSVSGAQHLSISTPMSLCG